MSLLVRPLPKACESWPGFLLRVAHANGFEGLYKLARIAQVSEYGLIGFGPLKVLPLLGYAPSLINVLENEVNNWKPRLHLHSFGRSSFGRVCPKCLFAGCDFIPAHWDHPLQLTCPVHTTLLVDRCPRCEVPIDYLRGHLKTCKCGADFRWIESEDQPSWLHRIYSEFDILEPYSRGLSRFAPFTAVDAQAAVLLVKLARLNGAPYRPELRVPQKFYTRFDLVRGSDFKALAEWFSPFPSSFNAQLSKIERDGRRTNSELLGSSNFPKIHALVKAVSTTRRLMPRPGRKHDDDQVRGDEVTLKKFLRGTNTSHDRFMYWLEKGLLQGVYVTKKGTNLQKFHIPTTEYFGVLNLLKRTAAPREVLQGYQIPRSTLKTLVNGGVLDGVYLNRANYVFRVHVSQVTQVVREILAVATRHLPKTLDPLPIDQALRQIDLSNRVNAKTFIDSITSRVVPVFVPRVAHKQWDNLVVDREQFNSWLANFQR